MTDSQRRGQREGGGREEGYRPNLSEAWTADGERTVPKKKGEEVRGRRGEDGRKVVQYGRLEGFRLFVFLVVLWRCRPRHDRIPQSGRWNKVRPLCSARLDLNVVL